MTDDNPEFEDQLPEPVVRNAEEAEANDQTIDLLTQLVSHVDKDQYIPWEKVQLPSEGVYYDDMIPNGMIEIKPMGADVDKMLANQRLLQSGEILNKIIESCIKLPPEFSIRDMLAGDFNFLMYYLRGITHGNDYEFSSECQHCGTKNLYHFDLGALAETIQRADPDHPVEPMSVLMPTLSKTFKHKVCALVRLIRMDDIMKMSNPTNDGIYDPVRTGRVKVHKRKKDVEIKNKGQDLSKMYDSNMKSQIIGFTIDDEEFLQRDKVDQIIDSLHQGDSAVIKDFLEKVSPSIESTLDATCANPECGEESTVALPFNENFFRSTAKP